MKKTFLRLMTVLLSLLLIFSFAACNPGCGDSGDGTEMNLRQIQLQTIRSSKPPLVNCLMRESCTFRWMSARSQWARAWLLDIPAISGKFTGDCYNPKDGNGVRFCR